MSRERRRTALLGRSADISRRVADKPIKKTVVVISEGSKTEPRYVEALAAVPDVRNIAAVSLRLEAAEEGEVPLTLVRRAVDYKSRTKCESGEVDEIWCAFDVEWPKNHPNLQAAVNLAQSNGIKLAISNPCFELWLILHFCDHSRFIDNNEAIRIRRNLDSQKGKHLNPELYMNRRAIASRRALHLEKRHEENDTKFPHDNPSSGMYSLLNSVSPRNWLRNADGADPW
jgi:RloB-like protein